MWQTIFNNVLTAPTKKATAHATLYLMMATPHWATYIVSYLKGERMDLPKHRLRAIAQEAQDYTLIGE